MIITLIGMAGSGKSVVGKKLAMLLDVTFIDIDKIIESHQGKRLATLVAELGDTPFLKIEEKTILALIPQENTIIATGGSAVYSESAMNYLKSFSSLIYLDTSYEEIAFRVGNIPRGIIGLSRKDLRGIYDERKSLYEKYAQIKINCDGMRPITIAEKIVKDFFR